MPKTSIQCNINSEGDEKFREKYQQFDKDGSGSLDRDEMTEFLRDQCHLSLKKVEVARCFHIIDTSGDGAIEISELVEGVAALRKKIFKDAGEDERDPEPLAPRPPMGAGAGDDGGDDESDEDEESAQEDETNGDEGGEADADGAKDDDGKAKDKS